MHLDEHLPTEQWITNVPNALQIPYKTLTIASMSKQIKVDESVGRYLQFMTSEWIQKVETCEELNKLP